MPDYLIMKQTGTNNSKLAVPVVRVPVDGDGHAVGRVATPYGSQPVPIR